MPIEFHCSECQSLLRVADSAAGKGARCPSCGNIEPVPESSQGLSEPLPSDASSGSGNPYAPQVAPPQSATPSDIFQKPAMPGTPTGVYISDEIRSDFKFKQAKARLAPPAIVVMVMYGLSVAFCCLSLIGFLINFADGNANGEDVATLLMVCFYMLLAGTVILGCVMMLRMRHYRFCMVASVLGIIAGFPCCLPACGFSIWALVVLIDHEVKSNFR